MSIKTAMDKIRKKNITGIQSEKIGDYSVTYKAEKEEWDTLKEQLKPYKRATFV